MEPTLSTPQVPAPLIPSFTPDGRVLFGCGSCRKKLSVKATTIGKSITCPHCKSGNVVPDPAALAAQAAAAVEVNPVQVVASAPGSAEPVPAMGLSEPMFPASAVIEPVVPSPVASAPAPEPAPVAPAAPAAGEGAGNVSKKPGPMFSGDGRVVFVCSNCGKKLSVKPTTIGKSINCAHCQTANVVPDPAGGAVKAAEPVAQAPEPVVTPAVPVVATPAAEPVVVSAAAPEPVAEPAPAPVPVPVAVSTPVTVSEPAPVVAVPVSVAEPVVAPVTVTPAVVAAAAAEPVVEARVAVPEAPAAFVPPVAPVVAAAADVPDAPVVSVAAEPAVKPNVEPVKSVVQSPAVKPASEQAYVPSSAQGSGPISSGMNLGSSSPGTQGGAPKRRIKIDGPDRFVFACYFCARKMSVKVTSVGRTITCEVCHNQNIVPSPEQARSVDATVTPTKEQWAIASQNVATGDQVEVRVFFPCYSCHKKLSAKIDQAGQALRCTGCSVVNLVPALATGLISPADESGSFMSPSQVVYDKLAADAGASGVTASEKLRLGDSQGETTVVMAPSAPALPSEGIPGEGKSGSTGGGEVSTPAAATAPNASVNVTVSTSSAAVPAASEAPTEYVAPMQKLGGEKPIGLADLGTASKGAAEPSKESTTVVTEAFSPVGPEVTPELDEEDDEEGVPEFEVTSGSKPEAGVGEFAITPPGVKQGDGASSGGAGNVTLDDDDFVLGGPGGEQSKTGMLEIPGRGLEHLDKSEALAMLAQAIPSAKPKAAEIIEDSAVLPPVKRPGSHSELALRKPGKSAKPEGEASMELADFTLPEPKQAAAPKAKPAEAADDDVFEPIGPISQSPVGPPKSILIEPVEALAALNAQPKPEPVKPVAKEPAPKEKEAGKPGAAAVPAGFIAFKCQGCSKRLTVKGKHAGKEMACPVCKQMNTVPMETPAGLMDAPATGSKKPSSGTGKPAGLAPASAAQEKKPVAPAPVAAKKPAAVTPGAKPAAAAPSKPAEQGSGKAAASAKPPMKPAAKPAAPKEDPDDPFAGLTQAAQGQAMDMTDALSALAGGAPQAGNELDDLASALGGVGNSEADADDITTALSMQTDHPDDGLVISVPEDSDAPIGLADDPTPGGGGKGKPAAKAAPAAAAAAPAQAKGPVPNAGKFIPTNKNDGKLRFPCSQCGHRLKVPPEAKGKKAKCPACGTVNNVPL
jgi:DNA-directed RNA polymerase subunit RPC12/RpoP